jgi:transposase
MTQDLLGLADWLSAAICTQVAMESTGVYWKPVYNLLEGQFEVLVVNAYHLKAVPGRKTDVKDAEWIAELLQHGLVRGSFIPDRPQRELRELTRYRTSVVRERAREINRVQKVLEDANIKLASVVTEMTGVSALAMVQAIIGGTEDPEALAGLARGRLKAKRSELERALAGRVTTHHRFLLAEQLAHMEFLEEAIGRVSAEIERRLRPFEEDIARLDSIPGVSRRTAEVLLAEVGNDLQRFPTSRHLASWAGLCPGNNESAGKRHSGRTRKGSPWLRETLVEVARPAGKTKTYLGALYHRLAARRGSKRAAVAVAHTILVIAYHLLTRKQMYQDLGFNYHDEIDRRAVQRRLVRRLEALGLEVSVQPMTVPV